MPNIGKLYDSLMNMTAKTMTYIFKIKSKVSTVKMVVLGR